jgi:hypothetical protein
MERENGDVPAAMFDYRRVLPSTIGEISLVDKHQIIGIIGIVTLWL